MPDRPNPGSREAKAAGCRCPVLDNCRGIRPPYPPDGWVINEDCPIHGLTNPERTTDESR